MLEYMRRIPIVIFVSLNGLDIALVRTRSVLDAKRFLRDNGATVKNSRLVDLEDSVVVDNGDLVFEVMRADA